MNAETAPAEEMIDEEADRHYQSTRRAILSHILSELRGLVDHAICYWFS